MYTSRLLNKNLISKAALNQDAKQPAQRTPDQGE